MLGNRRAQWIVLLFPLLCFDRALPSCVQRNIRINGESETSLPTKSSAQCEEECSRRKCPSWTWEGLSGQCQLKRRGKEGSKVGSKGAVSGTEEAGRLYSCCVSQQLYFSTLQVARARTQQRRGRCASTPTPGRRSSACSPSPGRTPARRGEGRPTTPA